MHFLLLPYATNWGLPQYSDNWIEKAKHGDVWEIEIQLYEDNFTQVKS